MKENLQLINFSNLNIQKLPEMGAFCFMKKVVVKEFLITDSISELIKVFAMKKHYKYSN
jgi:hypothetical protein